MQDIFFKNSKKLKNFDELSDQNVDQENSLSEKNEDQENSDSSPSSDS